MVPKCEVLEGNLKDMEVRYVMTKPGQAPQLKTMDSCRFSLQIQKSLLQIQKSPMVKTKVIELSILSPAVSKSRRLRKNISAEQTYHELFFPITLQFPTVATQGLSDPPMPFGAFSEFLFRELAYQSLNSGQLQHLQPSVGKGFHSFAKYWVKNCFLLLTLQLPPGSFIPGLPSLLLVDDAMCH